MRSCATRQRSGSRACSGRTPIGSDANSRPGWLPTHFIAGPTTRLPLAFTTPACWLTPPAGVQGGALSLDMAWPFSPLCGERERSFEVSVRLDGTRGAGPWIASRPWHARSPRPWGIGCGWASPIRCPRRLRHASSFIEGRLVVDRILPKEHQMARMAKTPGIVGILCSDGGTARHSCGCFDPPQRSAAKSSASGVPTAQCARCHVGLPNDRLIRDPAWIYTAYLLMFYHVRPHAFALRLQVLRHGQA